MPAHPAADLFPDMSEEAFGQIVASMKAIGYDATKPVLRYEGMVLDGRNRLRAAAVVGVQPVIVDVDPMEDPYARAWRENGVRRDMTPSQRMAVLLKIELASGEFQREREAAKVQANEARASKMRGNQNAAAARPANSGPSREGRPSERDHHAGQTAAALARKAGVSRSTAERVLRMHTDDPAAFEASARGEPHAPRKRPPPRIDHEQRAEDVRRMHREGLGTMAIAERMGLDPTAVSAIKSQLGIAATSPAVKLWADITRIASTLEGCRQHIEIVTDHINGADLAPSKETKSCLRSMDLFSAALRKLRCSLKSRLGTPSKPFCDP